MNPTPGPAPAPAAEPPVSSKGKWMALLAAFFGWMFDGMEMGLFPLAGRPALKELMGLVAHPDADKLIGPWFGFIIALFLVGAACGGLIFGWLGDRVGRVKAMIWSVLAYSIFSGLCAVVNAPWQLGALRFLASMGMGGEWALGVSLVMEIWPATSRPLLAGLIGAAANVGFFLVGIMRLGLDQFVIGVGDALRFALPDAWVDVLLRHSAWRMLFVLGAVPAFMTFFIRIFVPESERWKHATRTAPKTRVMDIFRGGIARHTVLGACLAGLALLGTWGSVQWIPAWTGQMASGVQGADAWAQNALAIGAIIFTIVVALLAEKFNRRIAYFGLCLLSLILCQYLFRARPAYGFWFLFVTFLAGGMTAGFYGWLPLYLPELFPTRMRATGAGFSFNVGRILAAGGTLVSGQLVAAFDGDYARMCSVISLIYVVGIVIIWLCPETKGKPLPE